jgi:hypothetical protein
MAGNLKPAAQLNQWEGSQALFGTQRTAYKTFLRVDMKQNADVYRASSLPLDGVIDESLKKHGWVNDKGVTEKPGRWIAELAFEWRDKKDTDWDDIHTANLESGCGKFITGKNKTYQANWSGLSAQREQLGTLQVPCQHTFPDGSSCRLLHYLDPPGKVNNTRCHVHQPEWNKQQTQKEFMMRWVRKGETTNTGGVETDDA